MIDVSGLVTSSTAHVHSLGWNFKEESLRSVLGNHSAENLLEWLQSPQRSASWVVEVVALRVTSSLPLEA
jgi:hypothetical protein